jgi:hypothetical protein
LLSNFCKFKINLISTSLTWIYLSYLSYIFVKSITLFLFISAIKYIILIYFEFSFGFVILSNTISSASIILSELFLLFLFLLFLLFLDISIFFMSFIKESPVLRLNVDTFLEPYITDNFLQVKN